MFIGLGFDVFIVLFAFIPYSLVGEDTDDTADIWSLSTFIDK